jgi:hypothetical protein
LDELGAEAQPGSKQKAAAENRLTLIRGNARQRAYNLMINLLLTAFSQCMIMPQALDLILQHQLSTFQLLDLQIIDRTLPQCLGDLTVERFMLPLKFRKPFFDSHLTHRFGSSDANAFRTFDWEIPNCRAIRDGVIPALNAARTAFT